MKKIISIILLTTILACDSKNKNDLKKDNIITVNTKKKEEKKPTINSSKKTKSTIISDFLEDPSTLENITDKNPIALFKESAIIESSRVITITKDNIKEVLSLAKDYKNLVITVKEHTIVKITDLENCKQSGSWATCMPYAKGYIKKVKLMPQSDHINNIIGVPDSQVRIAYLFN